MNVIVEDEDWEKVVSRAKKLISEDGSIPVLTTISAKPFVAIGCLKYCMDKMGNGVVVFSGESSGLKELLHGKIVIAGVHEFDKESFYAVKQILHFDMKEIAFEGKEQVCDAVMSNAKDWKECYLLLDSSVVDSAGHPGGMSLRDLLYFVQRIKNLKNIVGAGISGFDEAVAAKLLVELSVRLPGSE